jgi:site-specific DNA recombinase
MTKGFFSYLRVSTVRQGQQGTSLTEQREAIRRFADQRGLEISKEFVETETAAKRGRPVYNQMVKALKQGRAAGVFIHKIDRSSRNLGEWSELTNLQDERGIKLYFVNENLDLDSLGGRLSADIQAVIAAHYVRNLREEVKKGYYGRLKQGLLPSPAPIGYVDQGAGKPKTIDPVQGPLVKQAFELYATGNWSIRKLVKHMYELGLRSKKGQKVTLNSMCTILHNPFYMGIIQLKTSGQLYQGKHEPLISSKLFEAAQAASLGKAVKVGLVHDHVYRRYLVCAACHTRLIAEWQKGMVYYRCHTKECPQKTVREDQVEEELKEIFKTLVFNEMESNYFKQWMKKEYKSIFEYRDKQIKALQIQRDQLKMRMSNLIDDRSDGIIPKEVFIEKQNSLLLQENAINEQLKQLNNDTSSKVFNLVEQFLELTNSAYVSIQTANKGEKREMVKEITSNLQVLDKKLIVKLNYPFKLVSEYHSVVSGGALPDAHRMTLLSILCSKLLEYFTTHSVMLTKHLNTTSYCDDW